MKNLIKDISLFTIWLMIIISCINMFAWSSFFNNVKELDYDIMANSFDFWDEFGDLLDDWEPSRILQPTLMFHPENSTVFEDCSTNICSYYVLDVPNDIIEIWVDNVTSDPHCEHWWRYKFQGHSNYFWIGENITDSDISFDSANYPVLSAQDWTDKNYKIEWNSLTIFFDKNIQIAQFYDFVLLDNILVYKDYRTWEILDVLDFEIDKNQLELTFADDFVTDYWRVIIRWNNIADIDWRIAHGNITVWNKISLPNWKNEYAIDNISPTWIWKTFTNSGSTVITVLFSEDIFEIPWRNLYQMISDQNGPIIEHPLVEDVDVEWNEIRVFFSGPHTATGVTVNTWSVTVKVGNKNDFVY